VNGFENIGLSTPWVIGFIVSAVLVSISILPLVGWFIHKRIDKLREEKRKQAYLDRKAKVDDPYGYNYGSYYVRGTDFSGWWGTSIIAGFVALAVLIVQALLLTPYQEKYLNWYTIQGNVVKIDNILENGDYTTEVFIVTLDSTDIPLRMEDSRILTQEGQDVELLCGFSWVNFGNSADEANCSIREAGYTR